MSAKGYAVKNARGEILVSTVSPTQRGAMVNYIVVEAGCMVSNGTSDEWIKATFAQAAGVRSAELVLVEIRETKP